MDTRIAATDHSSNGVTVTVEFGECQWSTLEQEGRQVRKAVIRGTESFPEEGAPDVPVLVRLLQLPKGQADVTILQADEEPVSTGTLARLPENVRLDYQGSTRIPDRPDIMSRNALWPPRAATIEEVGMWRGHRLAALKIYPLRVNPVTGEGTLLKRVTLRVSFHGVRPNPIDPRPLSGTEQEQLQAMLGELGGTIFAREREPMLPTTTDFINGIDQYKLYVSEEGIYKITYQDLVQAGASPLSIEPRFLRLRNKGQDVAIFVSGETDGRYDPQDYIEFYGIPHRETYIDQYPDMYLDPYSDINVYWLSWDNSGNPQGLRLIEESCPIIVELDTTGGITPRHDPRNFLSTLHQESNRNFQRLSAADLDLMQDHWFMDDGIDGLESRSYITALPDPDSVAFDSAQIRVALTGLTFGEFSYRYHHAQLWLNTMSSPALDIGATGNPFDPWNWFNQNPVVVDTRDQPEGGIPLRALQNGNNTVTLQCMGDTPEGTHDTILPNWFEITYPRLFRAHDNQLLFNAPAWRNPSSPIIGHNSPEGYPIDTLYHFRIDQFTRNDISVYKLGSSVITNFRLTWIDSLGYVVEFQDYITQAVEYLALTQDQKLSPDSIRHCTTTGRLITSPFGAGYIAIAHPSFLSNPNLQALMTRRSADYQTMLVSTEEIFDEFNNGIYSPYAVKDFLSYAYHNWVHPPEMVLLVGDLVFDIKNNLGYGGNWMPSIYVNGYQSGWYPSDFEYSRLSGNDLVPDIGVGRIPCRNQSELDAALAKIVNYEDNAVQGPWRDTFLFISSETDLGSNFIFATHQIINSLPDWVMTQYLEEDTGRVYSGQTNELLGLFNQQSNAQVVSFYNGHGAGGTWAGTLWLTGNVSAMVNAYNLPFVTNFTCYICAFDSRESPEGLLGERFLFNPQQQSSGAIAVYGSVSLGWLLTGIQYQESLMPFVAQSPGLRLGDIITSSKGSYAANHYDFQAVTTLHQMVMFGDPAVRLNTPMMEIPLGGQAWDPDPFVEGSDTVTLEIPAQFQVTSGDWRLFTNFRHPTGYPYYGPFPTAKDPPSQDTLWQRHVNYSGVQAGDTISLSLVLPDSTFRFLSYLGYPTANYGSVRGFLHNGLSGTLARNAAVSAAFYRTSAYSETVEITNLASIPDTLTTSSVWQFAARIFPGPGVVIASAMTDFWVRDQFDSLLSEGSAVMIDRSNVLGPYMWETVPSFGPFLTAYDGRVTFRIRVETEDSVVTYSTESYRDLRDHRPNLSLIRTAPRLGGDRRVSVIDTVYNTGPTVIPAALVRYVFTDNNTGLQSTWQDTLHDIPGDGPVPIDFPMIFTNSFHSVQIFLDPDNQIEESNEFDNTGFGGLEVDHFQVTLARGTIMPGVSGSATISFDQDQFWVRIPPNTIIPDSAVLLISRVDSLSLGGSSGQSGSSSIQGGISLLGNRTWGYRLVFGDSSVAFRSLTGITDLPVIGMDTLEVGTNVRNDLGLYLQSPSSAGSGYWTELGTDTVIVHSEDTLGVSRVSVTGVPNQLGTFGVFQNIDNCVIDCGPRIDVSVESQLFGEGSYVPSHPKITAYIQDFNGIDLTAEKFWIALGDPFSSSADTLVSENDMAWTDTVEIGGSIGVSISPVFAEGAHWVSFYATDNLGNSSYVRRNFVVANQFEVLYVGNYPNPFQRQTLITYTLTDQATERVRIKIYTVSGRLIRTLFDTNPTPINYREIVWDGTDDEGNPVANGVYFARLRAVRDDLVLERTLKLAKLR